MRVSNISQLKDCLITGEPANSGLSGMRIFLTFSCSYHMLWRGRGCLFLTWSEGRNPLLMLEVWRADAGPRLSSWRGISRCRTVFAPRKLSGSFECSELRFSGLVLSLEPDWACWWSSPGCWCCCCSGSPALPGCYCGGHSHRTPRTRSR